MTLPDTRKSAFPSSGPVLLAAVRVLLLPNTLGCFGSLLVSLAGTAILLIVLLLINVI
jgi:hypothetical protein